MTKVDSRTGRFIDSIKINSISSFQRDGVRYWAKRRLPASRLIIPCANAFFRAVGNPVRVLSHNEAWQARELHSYRLLHGEEGYTAFIEKGHTLCAQHLPGTSLDDLAATGRLTQAALQAAGRELRRAHNLHCSQLGGGWSHADPHTGNFLFDERTGRARLIDFEATHLPHLSPLERHADDLLVVFQCLISFYQAPPWLEACSRIATGYFTASSPHESRSELLGALRQRLTYPRGLGRLWWAIRSGYIPATESRRRIRLLRQSLEKWCHPEALGTPLPANTHP